MNKIYTLLSVLLLTASAFAQSPEKMSYQAIVRDGSDALITNQTVGMQISILQNSISGTAVYVETQTPTSNINGLLTFEIGTGTTTDDFSTIDWSAGPYFIKTETDPTGGTNYTITGTSQLMSVPYALYAKTVESITEVDGSITNEIQDLSSVLTEGNDAGNKDVVNVRSIGVGTTNPSFPIDIQGIGGERLRAFSTDGFYAGLISKNNTREFFAGVQATYETNDASSGYQIYDNTAGAMRFVIDMDGDVGIGQSNPNAKLHVNGDFRLVDGTQATGKVLTSDASGYASWQTPTTDDADADPTNEIQDISISGTELNISSGSTIDLSRNRTVFLSPQMINSEFRSASITAVTNGQQIPYLVFPEGVNSEIYTTIPTPVDWDGGSIQIRILYSGTSDSGAFAKRTWNTGISVGESTNMLGSSSGASMPAPIGVNILTEYTAAAANLSSDDDFMWFKFVRRGANAADVNTGELHIYGFELVFSD